MGRFRHCGNRRRRRRRPPRRERRHERTRRHASRGSPMHTAAMQGTRGKGISANSEHKAQRHVTGSKRRHNEASARPESSLVHVLCSPTHSRPSPPSPRLSTHRLTPPALDTHPRAPRCCPSASSDASLLSPTPRPIHSIHYTDPPYFNLGHKQEPARHPPCESERPRSMQAGAGDGGPVLDGDPWHQRGCRAHRRAAHARSATRP